MMEAIIVGETTRELDELEARFGALEFVDSVAELNELVTDGLHAYVARGGVLYLAAGLVLAAEDRGELAELATAKPSAIVDEAIELVREQIVGADGTVDRVESPEAFEAAYLAATESLTAQDNAADVTVDGQTVVIRDGRGGPAYRIDFKVDGTVTVNDAILRRAGVYAIGALGRELVAGRALDAHELLALIAKRLGEVGPEQLLGFGRALGPSRGDKTNAFLPARNRAFRAQATVATLLATPTTLRKGTFTDVTALARELADAGEVTFLDQQCRELYAGPAAVEGFRAVVDGDGITLGGKSVKAAGVDVRAFGLHTQDGTGYVHIPVVVGAFDESNDGMCYAGPKTLGKLNGFLRETVGARRDFHGMSRELVARYYDVDVRVRVGDVVQPGDVMFAVGGVDQTWSTKADYGVVTHVIDRNDGDAVEVSVGIEAWFTGHAKIRGLGKGLVSDYASAGMTMLVDGVPSDALAIGPGILKDGFAASEALTERRTVTAVLTSRYNRRDYLRAKAKHGVSGQRNPEVTYGAVTVRFDDRTRTVTTVDPTAIAATGRVIIEAAPVGQAVGSTSLTLPQLSWLSGFTAGERLLRKHVLKPAKRRADALGYMLAAGKGHAPTTAPSFVLGEYPLPVETAGLGDREVLEAVRAAYPNGVVVQTIDGEAVWLHAGHVLAASTDDGFGIDFIGLAATAAELVRVAADVERAELLGSKGQLRLVRQLRGQCAERAQGKGVAQLHAVRWGAGAKVAASDAVPPMTIRIAPGGAVDRQLARMAGVEPGALHGRRALVGRMPFVVTSVWTIEYDARVSPALILANRADLRGTGKGDSDGDTIAVFVSDDELLTDLDAEIRAALPGYDSTLAVRGIAAHSPEAEMWGENSFTGKSVHDKLALRFTKSQDGWLDSHARMGEFAHIYTGFSYRMCDLGGLLAGLLVPGGAELAVAGSVLEEDYCLSLNVDGATPTLLKALEQWFRGKLRSTAGFAEAFRPELLGNADFDAALKLTSFINAADVDELDGDNVLVKIGFEIGKGRTTAIPATAWRTAQQALTEDVDLRGTLLGELIGHAAGVLGPLAGLRDADNADDMDVF